MAVTIVVGAKAGALYTQLLQHTIERFETHQHCCDHHNTKQNFLQQPPCAMMFSSRLQQRVPFSLLAAFAGDGRLVAFAPTPLFLICLALAAGAKLGAPKKDVWRQEQRDGFDSPSDVAHKVSPPRRAPCCVISWAAEGVKEEKGRVSKK